ncbi:MAG: hypothetical protein KDI83_01510 [Gammaproteobacteria bacterium]|nr:hypothetical protein [Gammaproteobacteria bacterium]
MKSEREADRSVLSDEEAIPKNAGVKPAARRVAYKTLLAAVVIGILALGMLWLFVIGQQEGQTDETLAADPDRKVFETPMANGLQISRVEDQIEKIDRGVASISDRLDQGFEAQRNQSAEVQNRLSEISGNIQAVEAKIADQRETDQALGRQIDAAISRWDSFIKMSRASKSVERKPADGRKPRPVKAPPFQLDAIDLWDDRSYLAISQGGRVAFLKTGEQQSGWTVTRIDRLNGAVELRGPAGQSHTATLPR